MQASRAKRGRAANQARQRQQRRQRRRRPDLQEGHQQLLLLLQSCHPDFSLLPNGWGAGLRWGGQRAELRRQQPAAAVVVPRAAAGPSWSRRLADQQAATAPGSPAGPHSGGCAQGDKHVAGRRDLAACGRLLRRDVCDHGAVDRAAPGSRSGASQVPASFCIGGLAQRPQQKRAASAALPHLSLHLTTVAAGRPTEPAAAQAVAPPPGCGPQRFRGVLLEFSR